MMVYLGGPVDMVNKGFQDWKNVVKQSLNANGIAVFDPAAAFAVGPDGMVDQVPSQIVQINEYALKACNVALFYLPKGVQTVGTPIEMATAHYRRQHSITVWADDFVPAYIQYYGGHVVKTMDAALEKIHYIQHNSQTE